MPIRSMALLLMTVVVFAGDRQVELKDLPRPLWQDRSEGFDLLGDFPSLARAREAYERQFIVRKLAQLEGNVTRTAEALKIERSHLYRKMKAYGIK